MSGPIKGIGLEVLTRQTPVKIQERQGMGKVIWLQPNENDDNDCLRLRASPEQFRMIQNRVKAAEGLTTRQREVFTLVGEGLPTKSIARRLGIAPATVKVHLSAIYTRFGTCNRIVLNAILEGRQPPPYAARNRQNERAGAFQAGL